MLGGLACLAAHGGQPRAGEKKKKKKERGWEADTARTGRHLPLLYIRFVDILHGVACKRCNEWTDSALAICSNRTRPTVSECQSVCLAHGGIHSGRVLAYALPPFLLQKFNRHSRLLTLALNREHVEGISAVVRERRWDDVCLVLACLSFLPACLPACATCC